MVVEDTFEDIKCRGVVVEDKTMFCELPVRLWLTNVAGNFDADLLEVKDDCIPFGFIVVEDAANGELGLRVVKRVLLLERCLGDDMAAKLVDLEPLGVVIRFDVAANVVVSGFGVVLYVCETVDDRTLINLDKAFEMCVVDRCNGRGDDVVVVVPFTSGVLVSVIRFDVA